jgi:hypothetical protein
MSDPEQIVLTLVIENHYPEDGDVVQTTVETTVPEPPYPPHSYAYESDDWEYDHIFCHTGTGRTEGDSAYFVEVTASSRPDLIPVGTKYEFGT